MLLSGDLRVTYEGHATKTLKPGMYAYGPANVPHEAVCADGAASVLFHTPSCGSGIKVLNEHQLPGFLQAQLLLVVNRTAPLGNSPLRRSVPKKATAEISP